MLSGLMNAQLPLSSSKKASSRARARAGPADGLQDVHLRDARVGLARCKPWVGGAEGGKEPESSELPKRAALQKRQLA
jgi:hypothetical protein